VEKDIVAEFIDGEDFGTESAVESAANLHNQYLRGAYKYWDFPPKYTYRLTVPSSPDADYLVYRESTDLDLRLIGAVSCVLIDKGDKGDMDIQSKLDSFVEKRFVGSEPERQI
jgi:hypothetical protein